MGREIRKVPKGWKHPTYREVGLLPLPLEMGDAFHPARDQTFDDALQEWLGEYEKAGAGEHALYSSKEELAADWGPPNPKYYRPAWTDEERTHFQIYETVSEGTPVSPVFESLDAMEMWLVEDGTWPGHKWAMGKLSPAAAKAFCKGGWAPSVVVVGGVVMSGAEGLAAHERNTS